MQYDLKNQKGFTPTPCRFDNSEPNKLTDGTCLTFKHQKNNKVRACRTGKQGGVSLYLGIIMLSLIFAIALIISNLFLIRLQLSRDILNSTSSFYGADSALECAQLEITKQTTINPSIDCPSLSNLIITSCSQIPMDNITGADLKPGIISDGVSCSVGTISSLRSAGSFKGTKRSTEVVF
ncbi:MAG: hypothetical protein UT37_C0006G0023 [Parcubacteria group bacterium GW2011_GWA2_39_18]|nr:MAG: hypothetical protein UT37_C0006G0023 [Parcubacteria group bacterium GW2011_GWA2_39_18]